MSLSKKIGLLGFAFQSRHVHASILTVNFISCMKADLMVIGESDSKTHHFLNQFVITCN